MEIERINWFPDGNGLILSQLNGYIAQFAWHDPLLVLLVLIFRRLALRPVES